MEEDIKELFDKFSDNYDDAAFRESIGTQWLSKIETDFILESCNIGNNTKILDIGVGTGRNSYLLSQKGGQIEGIDASEGMIKKARQKLDGRKINFILTDAGKDIPFRSNVFDYAVCFRVLKYIKTWRNTIKEVSRVLKKEGIFVLEIANLYSVQKLNFHAPYFLFDPEEVKEILEKEGLVIESIKGGTRIAFPLYKNINDIKLLNFIINSERFLDNIFPKCFLSRNIMIKSRKL